MELLSIGQETLLPSVINNPFSKTKVVGITVWYQESWAGEGWKATGVVKFKNGNTQGEQTFRGDTFDEVVAQIKAMLENLKDHE